MNDEEKLIDLNNADLETLVTLPGIGPAMAERIIAARPFTSVEDVEGVSGIGKSAVERIMPQVYVSEVEIEGEQPQQADPDSATAEDMEAEEGTPEESEETKEAEIIQPQTSQDEPDSIILLPDTSESAEMEATVDDSTDVDLPPATITAVVVEPEQHLAEDDELIELVSTAEEIESEGEELKPETEKASPADVEISGYVTQRQAFGIALTASVITFFFSVIFTLIFLAIINNGLRYVHADQLTNLTRYVNRVETAAVQIQQRVGDLATRVDNLEGLSGRISTLEDEVSEINQEIDTLTEETDSLTKQTESLSNVVVDIAYQVNQLQLVTTRFNNFLSGLRDLLNTYQE